MNFVSLHDGFNSRVSHSFTEDKIINNQLRLIFLHHNSRICRSQPRCQVPKDRPWERGSLLRRHCLSIIGQSFLPADEARNEVGSYQGAYIEGGETAIGAPIDV